MSLRTILASCLLVACSTSGPAAFASTLGNIMPLGDSITDGAGSVVGGGYRTPLYTDLIAAGYTFNYVGSLTDNPSAILTAAGQINHEGHSGYTISGIQGLPVASQITTYQPDITLLMIGTNDISGGNPTATMASQLDTLISTIEGVTWGSGQRTKLIVAQIVPRAFGSDNTTTVAYNALIPGIVATHAAAGEPVYLVDMFGPLSSPTIDVNFADTLHPNDLGYGKMASVWFNAIQSIQAQSVPEPSTIMLMVLGGLAIFSSMKRSRHA